VDLAAAEMRIAVTEVDHRREVRHDWGREGGEASVARMSVSEMRDLPYVDKPGLRFAPSGLRSLVKGASGQAMQNMNLLLGFPETMGLEQIALFP
jgi:hypothetical protein